MRLIDADRLLEDKRIEKYYHLKNGDIAIPLIDIKHAPTVEERTEERAGTHACDSISRQAAIDGFYEMAADMDHLCTVSDYVSFLESLPSAQPDFNTVEKIDKAYDDGYKCGYLQAKSDYETDMRGEQNGQDDIKRNMQVVGDCCREDRADSGFRY